jgi:hypothetical protein
MLNFHQLDLPLKLELPVAFLVLQKTLERASRPLLMSLVCYCLLVYIEVWVSSS